METLHRYLDSTGYFHPRLDSLPQGTITVYPGRRAIIIQETILRQETDTAQPEVAAPPEYPRPYNASEVQARGNQVTGAYTSHGYPFVTTTAEILPAGSSDSIKLVFRIVPDHRYTFAPPRLTGRYSTNKKLLMHDISIEPESDFDSREIQASVDRLGTRSYISAVSALPPLISRQDSSTAARKRIVVPFFVEDRSGMGLDGAAGLDIGDNERPQVHGNIRFAFTNLFHAGEEAYLSYEGDRSRQQLDIRFTSPRIFGLPFIITTEGGLEIVNEQYGYMSGSLGLFSELGIRWHAGVNLIGNNVSPRGSDNRRFAGADLVLVRSGEPLSDGTWSRELLIATGSGFTRKERAYNRSHIDFMAGGHIPFRFHQALLLRIVSGHIISRETDLIASEIYRAGGNSSVRGYSENEFSFRTVAYGQAEYLYYLKPKTPVYIFTDGGLGFMGDIRKDRSYLAIAGYGIGFRLPTRLGSVSVEWARNIRDRRSLGRVHVRFQNPFSFATHNFFSPSRK